MEYHNGQIVEGIITGVQPYGAFIQIDSNHNGLLHISEISEDYIRDINEYVKMRQKIKVMIIDVGDYNDHFKLSLKALNPSSKNRRRNAYHMIPTFKIEFESIRQNLDRWIEEAMEENDD